MHVRFALVALALTFASPQATSAQDLVADHLERLAPELHEYAAAALARIVGTDRQLLAARAYLRGHAHLAERWAWSQAQIDAYPGSPLQQRLDAAVDRVRRAFEAENPGHTLYVNPQVRSLDTQLDHWNRNESVGLAAKFMYAVVERRVSDPDFPSVDSEGGSASFRRVVLELEPSPTPTLAAPGLSPHGQMHAVDFQVRAGERTVAGPSQKEIAEVWERLGWRAKLEAAVRAGGGQFRGPLAHPYEPWHYDYHTTETEFDRRVERSTE